MASKKHRSYLMLFLLEVLHQRESLQDITLYIKTLYDNSTLEDLEIQIQLVLNAIVAITGQLKCNFIFSHETQF